MAYQALYRKYRLANFEDMVGQSHISNTISNAISMDKISHAYLFTGPRGTGKTSIAKLIAKAVNCVGEGVLCGQCDICLGIANNEISDIIEIDAASNNGVDEIRDIRDKVKYSPSMCKYKVYIIDEAHMLTTQAFNALLKTLEEPPSHVIFILATTEPYKIPLTILSRCQRFDFRKISEEHIIERLQIVIETEQIDITSEALKLIAYLSDGAMRDALSLLDQLSSYISRTIEVTDVYAVTGTASQSAVENLVVAIFSKDKRSLLKEIESLNNQGKDLVKLCESIIVYLRDALVAINGIETEFVYSKSDVFNNISRLDIDEVYNNIRFLNDVLYKLRSVHNPKIFLEVSLLNLSELVKTKIDFYVPINVDNSVLFSAQTETLDDDLTLDKLQQSIETEEETDVVEEETTVLSTDVENVIESEEVVSDSMDFQNVEVEEIDAFVEENSTVLSADVESDIVPEEVVTDGMDFQNVEVEETDSIMEEENLLEDNSFEQVENVVTEEEVTEDIDFQDIEDEEAVENINVSEEKKEIKDDILNSSDSDESSVDTIEEITPEMNRKYLNYLRGVRINNTFVDAQKEYLNYYKKQWVDIDNVSYDINYDYLVDMLKGANLRAAADHTLIVSVATEMSVIKIMSEIEVVENIISELLDKRIIFCAVSEKEWERIREDYIKRLQDNKPYEKLDEKTLLQYFNIGDKRGDLIEKAKKYFGPDMVVEEK